MGKAALAMVMMAGVLGAFAYVAKAAGNVPIKAAAMSIVVLPLLALAAAGGILAFMLAMFILLPVMMGLQALGFDKVAPSFLTFAAVMGALSLALIAAAAAGIFAMVAIVALVPITGFLYVMTDGGLLDYIRTSAISFGNMDMKVAATGFGKLALIFLAISMATASAALALVPAAIGTIALIPIGLFLVGMNEFIIPALLAFDVAAAGIKDWAATSKAFLGLAAIMGTIAIAAIGAAAAGMASIVGMIGTPIAALFIVALAGLFLPALSVLTTASGWSAIKDGELPKAFIALGKIFASMAAISGTLLKLAVFGTLGMIFGSPFDAICDMFTGIKKLTPKLVQFKTDASAAGIAGGELVPLLVPLGKLFSVLGSIDKDIQGLASYSGLGSILTGNTFDNVKGLLDGIIKIGPSVSGIAEINIVNPDKIAKVMSALGPIFKAMGTLGEVGIALAEIDLAAVSQGGKAGAIATAITEFITTIKDAVKTMLVQVASMMTDHPESGY